MRYNTHPHNSDEEQRPRSGSGNGSGRDKLALIDGCRAKRHVHNPRQLPYAPSARLLDLYELPDITMGAA